MRQPPKILRVKGSIRLSYTGHNHIQDFKQSCFRLATADPEADREEVGNAYADMKMREREISEYIEVLEAALRIRQPILKRF